MNFTACQRFGIVALPDHPLLLFLLAKAMG